MEGQIQLIVVPVSDADRSKKFYEEQAGFEITVDHRAGDFRVVQAEPRGSACSIAFGSMLPMEPGTLHGIHLIVRDIEAACAELSARGVDVGPLHHFVDGQETPGAHPDRGDYESFSSFQDPDGNTWVLQEIGYAPAR